MITLLCHLLQYMTQVWNNGLEKIILPFGCKELSCSWVLPFSTCYFLTTKIRGKTTLYRSTEQEEVFFNIMTSGDPMDIFPYRCDDVEIITCITIGLNYNPTQKNCKPRLKPPANSRILCKLLLKPPTNQQDTVQTPVETTYKPTGHCVNTC